MLFILAVTSRSHTKVPAEHDRYQQDAATLARRSCMEYFGVETAIRIRARALPAENILCSSSLIVLCSVRYSNDLASVTISFTLNRQVGMSGCP